MLASEWHEKRVKALLNKRGKVFLEPKYDGERRIAIKKSGEPFKLHTRRGHECTVFPFLLDELNKLFDTHEGVVLDGEIYPRDQDFQRLASMSGAHATFTAKEANVAFCVFDILTYEEWLLKQCHWSYTQRRASLTLKLNNGENVFVVPAVEASTLDDIDRLYCHWLDEGLEGAIIKDPLSLYEYGKRSQAWIKKKQGDTVDLVVEEILRGDLGGAFENSLGRLVCRYKGHVVHVGPGKMPHHLRHSLWESRECIGKVIEVAYQNITNDGSLRSPRFIRFRPDKD
jgi:ATP-dependent DNA ligase